MKKAVIITGDKYPCGDAGAIRQHALAKILQSLGYEVLVAGYGEPTGKTEKEFERVKYKSFRTSSDNKLVRLFARAFFGQRVMHYIRKEHSDADLFLVVDVLPYAYRKIKSYAEKRRIKLLHDSVEWYSPEEFSGGEKNIEYRLKEITNTKLIKGSWRVIAISTFLQEHFEKACERVARIPVIMDTGSIEYRTKVEPEEKIRFVYAGAPGWKDYLREVVSGFARLSPEELDRLEIHFIGITKEQLKNGCRVEELDLQKLEKVLYAHGRVPHAEAVEWVKKADYTLLARDASLRYAKAGFPTKIVESLSCGTPPVCNLSSDLALYLKDGENAFLADSHLPEDFAAALRKALSVSAEQRGAMRIAARKTAEEQFDYKVYTESLKSLI